MSPIAHRRHEISADIGITVLTDDVLSSGLRSSSMFRRQRRNALMTTTVRTRISARPMAPTMTIMNSDEEERFGSSLGELYCKHPALPSSRSPSFTYITRITETLLLRQALINVSRPFTVAIIVGPKLLLRLSKRVILHRRNSFTPPTQQCRNVYKKPNCR